MAAETSTELDKFGSYGITIEERELAVELFHSAPKELALPADLAVDIALFWGANHDPESARIAAMIVGRLIVGGELADAEFLDDDEQNIVQHLVEALVRMGGSTEAAEAILEDQFSDGGLTLESVWQFAEALNQEYGNRQLSEAEAEFEELVNDEAFGEEVDMSEILPVIAEVVEFDAELEEVIDEITTMLTQIDPRFNKYGINELAFKLSLSRDIRPGTDEFIYALYQGLVEAEGDYEQHELLITELITGPAIVSQTIAEQLKNAAITLAEMNKADNEDEEIVGGDSSKVVVSDESGDVYEI